MANRTVSTSRFLIDPSTHSLDFNGTNSYATVPVTPDVTNGFCFAFWIQRKFLVAQEQIISFGTPFSNLFCLRGDVAGTTGRMTFLGFNTSAAVFDVKSPYSGANKWIHVVCTFVPNSAKMYFNTVAQTTDTSCTLNVVSSTLTLGTRPDLFNGFFSGRMRNFTFQNTATPWTQTEVDDLYYRNKIPTGALQWSLNNTHLDQNGENGLTLSNTSYSTVNPAHMKARSSATGRYPLSPAKIDGFNRANGALGVLDTGETWNHTGWLVSTNKAMSVPTLGSEMVTNGGFASDTTGWTASNSTLASVAGGSSGNCLEITNVGANLGIAYQAITTVVGQWYYCEVSSKNGSTTGIFMVGTTLGGSEYFNKTPNSGSWVGRSSLFRATTTTTYITLKTGVATDALTTLYDTVMLKPVTLSTTMATVETNQKDFVMSLETTPIQSGGIGIVASLDSYSNPQNFVILEIVNSFNVARMTKCVNGVYTVLFSVSLAYKSGRVLKLVKSGTSYSFYYDGILQSTAQTVTDSSIISNTLHGMFSPDTQSSIDNFYFGTGTRSLT